jgi:hypothetical protein
MKKIFFILLSNLLILPVFWIDDLDIQSNIIPDTTNNVVNFTWADEWFGILDTILLYIKDSIFNLLALFAIGVFLYTGFLLVTARWNQEQFKKAMTSFLYAVIGLVIVSLAWAAVRIIAWLTL